MDFNGGPATVQHELAVSLYSNPNEGQFTVASEEEGTKYIEVINVRGQVVFTQTTTGNRETIALLLAKEGYTCCA